MKLLRHHASTFTYYYFHPDLAHKFLTFFNSRHPKCNCRSLRIYLILICFPASWITVSLLFWFDKNSIRSQCTVFPTWRISLMKKGRVGSFVLSYYDQLIDDIVRRISSLSIPISVSPYFFYQYLRKVRPRKDQSLNPGCQVPAWVLPITLHFHTPHGLFS